jgi:hypothetical protein
VSVVITTMKFSEQHFFFRHEVLICFKAISIIFRNRTTFENCMIFTNGRSKPRNTSFPATDKRQKQSIVYVYVSVRDFPVSNSERPLPSTGMEHIHYR